MMASALLPTWPMCVIPTQCKVIGRTIFMIVKTVVDRFFDCRDHVLLNQGTGKVYNVNLHLPKGGKRSSAFGSF